jgi:hypothetical protein
MKWRENEKPRNKEEKVRLSLSPPHSHSFHLICPSEKHFPLKSHRVHVEKRHHFGPAKQHSQVARRVAILIRVVAKSVWREKETEEIKKNKKC